MTIKMTILGGAPEFVNAQGSTQPSAVGSRHLIAAASSISPGALASPDHLIGAQQHPLRDREAERLGGLLIHDELDMAGLFDR